MGAGAQARRHEPVVQLVRLHHVLVLPDIGVPVHVGHRRVGVRVRGVRQPGGRQPGPLVDGRAPVHRVRRHDRHPQRAVPAPTPRHRHGHPPTDRGKPTPAVALVR